MEIGDADAAVEAIIRTGWNKFRQLVPLLTNKDVSLIMIGRLYSSCVWSSMLHGSETWPVRKDKKLSYRRGTARCVVSIENLPIATKQCRNYLYDKSWPNRWYEVGDLVGGNASWTMCTQPWRDRVGCHCLRCHKQTDDGRVVYITCIPTTCCGEIF